ncbi:colicin transporter [Paraburkholderia sp. Tr-20389]|nr:colicin transporter [Paraburkholderia sp. Tr-20389]
MPVASVAFGSAASIRRVALAASLAFVACAAVAPGMADAQQSTPGASSAVAASGAAAVDVSDSSDFDLRQKALDGRTADNNYRYAVAQHNCYSKFFVNHCLNSARDDMRVVAADIRKEQLALDDEKRMQHARQRDEQAAVKRAQYEADAPGREAQDARNAQAYEDKQRQHQLNQAQREAEAPQRSANEQAYQQKQQQHAIDQAQRGISPSQAAANQKAYDAKQADFQRKLDEAHRQAAQKAQERVEKQQRYEQKQTEATQHKADVEERQKQAAEKARQKQDEQAKQQQQLDQQQKQQQQQ